MFVITEDSVHKRITDFANNRVYYKHAQHYFPVSRLKDDIRARIEEVKSEGGLTSDDDYLTGGTRKYKSFFFIVFFFI